MLRSLYSGVAGMTTQQTKMDVIGNNISNVSTYGFKSSRVTFSDVYYQTSTNATAATSSKGGTNAVQVGYGSSLGSTDVNLSQSVLTNTGLSLDVAITGDGFLQVMDGDGNTYYTKAGMLDIDAAGNLVDINGNFVLGVSGETTNQAPNSNKIKISLPYEDPDIATASDTISGVAVNIKSTNNTDAANVSLTFASSTTMPIGQKAAAVINSSSINITLNANETFATLDDLQTAVNEAITSANNGVAHAAGDFNITLDPDDLFGTTGLTGSQIVSADFGVTSGSVTLPDDMTSAFSVTAVGDGFSYDDPMDFTIDVDNTAGTCTITAGGGAYSATLLKSQMNASGSVLMKSVSGTSTDNFTLTFPSWTKIQSYDGATYTATAASVPSKDSGNLGLGSSAFNLEGGTAGGEQTVADLTGISIGSNGVITGTHPTLGTIELGRIDLATFENPEGLSQVGNTYFAITPNSGPARLTVAGTNGSGSLAAGKLEASNVDLSQEFADMITTQRGFQACSRLITVSDTMLEELINLKR
ncbi:MAG: flagellar hook-basal body complex protein [Oscillospiraceae bacterium]